MILLSHGMEEAMTHFNLTEQYEALEEELTEAFNDGEYDDCVDIIVDIEQARKLFNSNLPDWHHVRWSTAYVDNQETWSKAFNQYQSNLTNVKTK